MNKENQTLDTNSFSRILTLIDRTKADAILYANRALVDLYWEIGEIIYFKVKDQGWRKNIVSELSETILSNYPDSKGFSARNIWRMKQFYETYMDILEKLPTPLAEISWSNHIHIMSKVNNSEERFYYLELAAKTRFSARDLARIIDSSTYERNKIANMKLPMSLVELSSSTENDFKDTYVFEFLGLSKRHSENELKQSLLANMKNFLLEMGSDFSSIGDEYVVQVGNKDYRIDILLHHRGLNCLVAVELKTTEFKPEYLGKLEFYLEALDRDIKKTHEKPSVGILICQSKDDEIVEYALSRNMSPAMIAEYKTQLIDKKILQNKLHELTLDKQLISLEM